MFKVNATEYAQLLGIHSNTNTPLFVYGAPGIGKSAIPRQVFQEKADKLKKTFVEWSDLTQDQKTDCIENPEKFFVFVDFRLGQCDTTDLRGIPNMTNNDLLEYMPLAWVKYFSNEEAHGAIFFDEMNLAPPVVAGQAYQIINDRVVSDIRLSDHVFIFGAGNRSVDKAHTFNMAFPLRDRMSEFELEITSDEWCDWACANGIDMAFVSFIKWKPSRLHKVDHSSNEKGSTPRGIVRANTLVKEVGGIKAPLAHHLVSSAVGEPFAIEFKAYTDVIKKMDLEKFIKDPKSVKTLKSPDKQFAICGVISEHIVKTPLKDKKRIQKLYEIMHNLPIEFMIVSMNMTRLGFGKNNAGFRESIELYDDYRELCKVAAKFAF